MSKPTIAAREPAVLKLAAGSYWWCRCGLSKKQPFCDGSHKTTDLTPLELKLDAEKTVALCQCKQTRNPPFCDGTHARI